MQSSPERLKILRKIERCDVKFAALRNEHRALLASLAKLDGFVPCGDCMDGACTMNCSSAPLYMKVSFP